MQLLKCKSCHLIMSKMFSVCMSVYHGDNAVFFNEALTSIYEQTRQPDEIVLVVDGPVGNDINGVIEKYQQEWSRFRVVRLEKNCGHAIARQTGLDVAKYEYIAIMDSDDIANADRFEKQIGYVEQHPEVDVVGGQINEFIGKPDNIVGTRIVPINDSDIKNYLKSRCPMNLVTVMLKKDSVQKVGGYIDWYCEEDYYLWVRMAEAGMTFANLPDNLVNVRVGEEMYQRRGGVRYFKSEARLQKYMLNHDIISLPRFIYNIVGRFVIQVAMPNSLRGFVFQKIFRK